MLYNLYRLDFEWSNNEENSCEDTEAWCTFISEFECNEDQVQEKCPKACHQCNGKHLLTKIIYILHNYMRIRRIIIIRITYIHFFNFSGGI